MHTSNAAAVFTSNTIRNLTTNIGTGTTTTASVIGLNIITTPQNHTLSQNTISALTNTNATAASVVTGIQFTGGTANVVERNYISGLSAATNSTAAEVNGIRVAGGTTVYRNNMITIGAGIPNAISTGSTTGGVNGINEPLGTDSFFHNSVYIGGAPTAGVGPSYAFNSSQTFNTRTFRNNIFYNTRSNSGASGKNYIVRVGGTTANPAGLTINNNDYFADGAGAVFGFFNSADVADLTAWQAAVGQDAASIQMNPLFVSTTDLHLTTASPARDIAANVGVANDFDNDPRPASMPDIGADELVMAVGGVFPSGTFYNAVANNGDMLAGNVTITNQLTLNGILNAGSNTLTFGCDATVAGAGASNYVIGNVAKQFCATGSFTYPVGTTPDSMRGDGVALPEYSPFTASVTALGMIPSTLTVNVVDGVLPGSSAAQSASRYWDVTETGDLTADISYVYLDMDVNGDETMYSVLRREAGTTAVYPGGTVNDGTNTATATGVTMFSQWGAGNLAPLAASVSVGGRVATPTGRGIAGARIYMSDLQGNVVMRRTNSSGYYRFTEVEVGETYILSVTDKNYRFDLSSQTLFVNDENLGVNFYSSGLNDDKSDLPPTVPEKYKE